MSHAPRINLFTLAPANLKAMINLSMTNKKGALGERLVELVQLRVSLVNGCGVCIDLHWRDLVRQDVDPRHLNAVAGWREAPVFSDRERAALRWAEIVARIPNSDANDEEFAALKTQFSDEEIADLSFAIAAINAWNLLNVSLRNPMPENP